jgi:response regulator RpfG family c-di-GMP phosphodiesterase
VLKSEAPPGSRERMTERRSRKTKGIVVLIDGDSRSCDRVARGLEVHGYHVLTAENPSEGAELVRTRRPDAVVASDGPAEDNDRAVRDTITSHLPAHVPLILRCSESIPDRYTDVNVAGHSRVVRVHRSLAASQLGWLLDRVVRKESRPIPGPA